MEEPDRPVGRDTLPAAFRSVVWQQEVRAPSERSWSDWRTTGTRPVARGEE
jgi:hypothetical protein